jgi:F0F1-type ATP synthase assembly protein I
MAQKKRASLLTRSAQSLQENVTQSGSVAGAAYSLVGGLILLGGIGYAVDHWRGTSPWFTLAGLLLGVVVGFYELIKTVYGK